MQAIIITAYKDPEMLSRLCEKFDRNSFRLFIHIDKRYAADFDIKSLKSSGNTEIYSKYAVTWGSIRHLYAILALMKRALRYDDIKYFHIISGQDYPVCDLSEAEEDRNIYLDFAPLPAERIRQYNPCQRLDQKNRIVEHIYRGSVKLQKALGIERKKMGAFSDVYKGTVWCSMPRDAAAYALDSVENNRDFMRDLYYSYIPEEIFFQTIFMNSPEWKEKTVRDNKRYDDWTPRDNSPSVPVILDARDYEAIKGSRAWFARKLDSSLSGILIKKLEGNGRKMDKGLVSIVITTCRRSPEILLRAVRSALAQTYENREVIVINDAPETDGTVREALGEYPDVRYVLNDGDHGVSNVRNLALREYKGDYLAFLDDDDEWLPEKISLQVDEFDDETGLVYCDFFAIKNGEVLRSDDKKDHPTGAVFERLLGENFVGGCSIPLIKRDALSDAGEFDTGISFGEDYDMWLRIAGKNKVGCVRRKLVNYYIGNESLTVSFGRREQGWEYLLKKYREDYDKNPASYREMTAMNVLEAAKRTPLSHSIRVWKKYGCTGDFLKGLVMKTLRIY